MLFGYQLGNYPPGPHGSTYDEILAVARACEEAGFDSVWVADHFMWPNAEHPEEERPQLECLAVLAALAQATARVRLGQLVVGVPYRNPALLAKSLTTLDLISHGRSIIGLGAGWHEPEFRGYGWPFPSVRERFEMLEEATQIVRLMLTERPATFEGKHYKIEDALNDPRAEQRPRPPIMIGGSGEKRTLRLVAQYADLCNVFGTPEEVARRYGVLRDHCANLGRSPEEVTRTNHVSVLIARDEAELAAKKEKYADRLPSFAGLIGTPERVIEGLRQYAAIGSQWVTLTMPDAAEVEPIRLFGETVVPALADV